jgi:hypothetical protein
LISFYRSVVSVQPWIGLGSTSCRRELASRGAGALVVERQGPVVGRQGVGQAGAGLGRLRLDAGERLAGLLGLDDAGGLAVDVEQVVGDAVPPLQRALAPGDPAAGVEARRVGVLDDPAGAAEVVVELASGLVVGPGPGGRRGLARAAVGRQDASKLLGTATSGSGVVAASRSLVAR